LANRDGTGGKSVKTPATEGYTYPHKEWEKRAEEDGPRSCALLRFWLVGGGVSVNASMQQFQT